MAQEWKVDSDRTIDVGDEGEEVTALRVELVGGRVSVLAHDEPTATVEISQVIGAPVRVAWDGSTLVVEHRKPKLSVGLGLSLDLQVLGRCAATVTVYLPRTARPRLETVSADVLVDGLDADLRTETVSGTTTLRDLRGCLRVDTVSGSVTGMRTDGEVHVNTVSGNVTLAEARTPLIDLDSVSGSLVADLAAVDDDCLVDVDGVSASVHLRMPPLPVAVSCDSMRGSVTVDGHQRPRDRRSFAEDGARVRVTLDGVSSSAVIVRREVQA